MTFIDWFAGVGGFRRGMELAGHRCVGFCEFDKFAVASYTSMHLITDEHTFTIGALPDICRQRPGGTYAERLYTVVEYSEEYEFFDIGNGEIIAAKAKLLSPFSEDTNYKYHKDGNIIEVGGIIAEGYVMPMKIGDGLKGMLSRIVKGLK